MYSFWDAVVVVVAVYNYFATTNYAISWPGHSQYFNHSSFRAQSLWRTDSRTFESCVPHSFIYFPFHLLAYKLHACLHTNEHSDRLNNNKRGEDFFLLLFKTEMPNLNKAYPYLTNWLPSKVVGDCSCEIIMEGDGEKGTADKNWTDLSVRINNSNKSIAWNNI